MASKKKIGFKCRIATVLLVLFGSIAALIAVAVIQDTWAFKEYSLEYGIVIDAGSSRSNVYLYEWPGEKENETGVVTETLNCRVNSNGISDMEVDTEDKHKTLDAFQDCMVQVMKAIPAEKHQTTPLFLGATAGMRLLHQVDEQRSNKIMASLADYLRTFPFAFQNASILSGQEEGLYGWVSVNYLMGNFLERNLWNTYVHPEGRKTVGSMDLGGASTQIAFVVQDDLKGNDYLQVKLYGYPYTVYTHSYLCYGKNEIQKRVLDAVIQLAESPDAANISNPCYPEGFTVTEKASAIYDTPCTEKPNNYQPDKEYFMVGAPDSDKCSKIIKSQFDFNNCSSSQCSFNGVEQPAVTGEFMAYAGFYFTARALMLNATTDLDQFNSTVREFCHTHWTVLKEERPKVSDRFLKTYCYAGHYIVTLLADGYKFDKETWKNVHFEKEVKETSIGWSLGYMLSMSHMIPSEVKYITPMTNPVFAGLTFLLSALIIVTLIIVFIILIRTCY